MIEYELADNRNGKVFITNNGKYGLRLRLFYDKNQTKYSEEQLRNFITDVNVMPKAPDDTPIDILGIHKALTSY